MKVHIYLVLTALVLLGCNSDEDRGLCLIGSGIPEDYVIELTTFNEVALFGPVNLKIRQDSLQEVTVIAEPEIFNVLTYEVIDQRLDIGIKENLDCYETERGVTIRIAVPDIENIYVVGFSDINSIGGLDLDRLGINIQGAANVMLSGTVEEHVINVSGETRLYNFELLSDETRITVSGAAELEVACESLLEINVAGVATIRYKGTPEISRIGAGSITLINSN